MAQKCLYRHMNIILNCLFYNFLALETLEQYPHQNQNQQTRKRLPWLDHDHLVRAYKPKFLADVHFRIKTLHLIRYVQKSTLLLINRTKNSNVCASRGHLPRLFECRTYFTNRGSNEQLSIANSSKFLNHLKQDYEVSQQAAFFLISFYFHFLFLLSD